MQNLGRVPHLSFLRVLFVLAVFVGFAAGVHGQQFRSIDGTGNNVANPNWGAAGIELRRVTTEEYGDGVSAPAGGGRAGPREVSNAVCAQLGQLINSVGASDFVWQWGQFVDHDIDLTDTHDAATAPQEFFPILVPAGDPFFDPLATGAAIMPLMRSLFVSPNPRQQVNGITSWIDASNVYGSDTARAAELRLNDGSGRLKTSAGDLLPFNVNAFPNAQPGGANPADFFLGGDVRANEQVGLTALHTLFVREHNRLADEIAAANPSFTDDDIYFASRRIVGAQMQVITYNEFLPVLLGPTTIPPYAGYDDQVEASIQNVFSTAAYRFGHSMLSGTLLRLEPTGQQILEGNLQLRDAFFNPSAIIDDGGISPLLRGLAKQFAQDVDTRIIDDVRNFLFGPPGSGGFDLASLNMQRGRDHGLADYNQVRVDLGLSAVNNFSDITSDVNLQNALFGVYGDVNDIDAWTGALAEDHLPGAMVGELLLTVLGGQFEALRDGDRYWYENDLSGQELSDVQGTTLADIIRRNTAIAGEIQDNVFLVEGAEFSRGDCNQGGLFDIGDPVYLVTYLFLSGPPVVCEDACDVNSDGLLDVADAIFGLAYLFLQGPPPAVPFPGCGPDGGANTLTCHGYQGCP